MKQVYMCFGTDVIHMGHISIINKAAELGRVTIGVLTDEVVASYRRFPAVPFEERMDILRNIRGVAEVIPQRELMYETNLRRLKPDYVVHGDDWRSGIQKPIRDNVAAVLSEIGGELVEFAYSRTPTHDAMEKSARRQLAMPDARRGRLRRLLALKPLVRVMEAHSGLTGLIVENTSVFDEGMVRQFDAMWLSSLCDSTGKGKPDIELVDLSARMQRLDEILDVTTKPIVFDCDTGGQREHFVYNIRTLERMGVSAVIIEDKTGLKKNSLFGTDAAHVQEEPKAFCEKIAAGKNALKTKDFMLIARIESLILGKGIEDALARAKAYVQAGADGIMIHSCQKEPDEVFAFCDAFRQTDSATPLVVVPTAYSTVREEELVQHKINMVIYANQFTRAAVPAMLKAANSILASHRASEAEENLMPYKEIIRLIPEE